MTAGVREPSEWSSGPSDIEGKTTRVGASECGQRTSFNRTRVAGHMDEIQGVVASTLKLPCDGASLLANSFGVGFIVWLGGCSCSNVAAVESRRKFRRVIRRRSDRRTQTG